MSQVVQTIWKQITIQTKMRVGAREPKIVGENELVFKVHSKPLRYISVRYDKGDDAYTVEYFRLKRNTYERTTLTEQSLVYVDSLNLVIDGMVNQ